MNLKVIGLSAVAVAATVAGSTLAVSPAQAAGLSGQLDFVWLADASPNSIDFYTFAKTADDARGDIGDILSINGTGSFAPLDLGAGVVKDLTTIPISNPISKWLDFAGDKFDFTLTSFVNTSSLQYKFKGFFADGTLASGDLTTQIGGAGVKSYSATITASGVQVPTPALLPGLLGLGLGVVRKRKAEAKAEAEIS